MRRLEDVLRRLEAAGLKLKPAKCQLMKTSVTYLGQVVSAEGVATDPKKIKAVEEWTTPSNLKEPRSFLGLCSYYQRFIQGFPTLAKPLPKLTKKSPEFVWGPHQEAARQKLITAPVLAYSE